MSESIIDRLNASPAHLKFAAHPYFKRVQSEVITREQVAHFIGQWWHPLHYFPTFLARCVANIPDIDTKSAVARILYQESGQGSTDQAHEMIYIHTMEGVGFERSEIVDAPATEETQALLAGYERASASRLSALGFIFATEVIDLAMVSSIGTAVERLTGESDLEWVNIHVQQEPDHGDQASKAVMSALTEDERSSLMASAEEMWRLWYAFFERLERDAFHPSAVAAQASAAPQATIPS